MSWSRRQFLRIAGAVAVGVGLDRRLSLPASISLSPSTAAAGDLIGLTGTGFGKRLTVNVYLDGAKIASKRSTTQGRVSLSFTAPTAAGGHVVEAVSSVGSASATLTVTAVVATPPPPPVEPPPPTGVPAFLSRPSSPPIVRDGGTNVLIEGLSIRGGSVTSPSGIGITIRNVNGTITIQDNDFADLVGGIYIYNCTGTLLIHGNRWRNIGDGSIGSGRSNHIQLAESSLSGFIRKNKGLGGRTEDMFSTWHSGGRGAGQELIIEDNQLQGLVADTPTARAWDSPSGTGIIISDGGGSAKNGYIIVRRNTLLTPGQVGIQHIDGPGIQTYENVIYGEKRRQNNNPITSWEGNPRGVVRDNRYMWTNENGSTPSPWFHSGSGLTVTGNVRDTTIDPAALRVVL